MPLFYSPRIAVMEMFGVIGSTQRTVENIRLLQALRENDNIRSVVLDIDSPGGTVAGSDYLHRAVSKLAAKKPVIAFIRGTGASGGYMVSLRRDEDRRPANGNSRFHRRHLHAAAGL